MDESKYLYLLNLDVDTLCVDCAVSDCEALFLNAHLFKKLRKLTLKNLERDLNYISFFRKLRILEIECKASVKNRIVGPRLDLKRIIRPLKKCTSLRSVSISGVSCKYSYTKKIASKGYFKSLNHLKTLKLNDVQTNRPAELAKDIRINCQRLDTLVMTNCGVNLFNFPRKRNGLGTKTKIGFGSTIDYVEIDGYLTSRQIMYYFTADRYYRSIYDNRLWTNDTLFLKPLLGSPKIKHLVLSNSGSVNNDLNYAKTVITNPQNAYESYLLFFIRDWSRSYRIDKLSMHAGLNKRYIRLLDFYQSRVTADRWFSPAVDSLIAPVDTPKTTTYIGKLTVGVDSYSEWLPYLMSYDEIKKKPLHWDTTKVAKRRMHTAYGNEYITPILWQNIDKTPKYFTKRKMKNIASDYQSFAKIEKAFRKKKVTYYKISFDRNASGSMLPELAYKRKNNSSGYSRLRSYTFTTKSKQKAELLTGGNILGAWPTFDAEDGIYYLVYKTTKRIDSVKINWWDVLGDTLRTNMPKVISVVGKTNARKDRLTQRSTGRTMRSYFRRKKHLKPGDIGELVYKINVNRKQDNKTEISKMELEQMYQQYVKDPWPFYAKAVCSEQGLSTALCMQGYTPIDETEWYMQYASVDLFTARSFDSNFLYNYDMKILLLDSDKKTYTELYNSLDARDARQRTSAVDTKVILPSSYTPGISVVLFVGGRVYYTSRPYRTLSTTPVQGIFTLENLPLSFIDYETWIELIEN